MFALRSSQSRIVSWLTASATFTQFNRSPSAACVRAPNYYIPNFRGLLFAIARSDSRAAIRNVCEIVNSCANFAVAHDTLLPVASPVVYVQLWSVKTNDITIVRDVA